MKAELIDYFGDDLMIVNVARVSYDKEVKEFGEKDERLINYLLQHKHTSPFRHPQLQFRITCPIYVERQLFKHQVGMSANSISGRYVDFSDHYYTIPEGQWRRQSLSSKQGSEGLIENQKEAEIIQREIIDHVMSAYEKLIKLGVSKEQARSILPLNLETKFIWTGSLLAFLHLFDLRLKAEAQQETRELVQQMKKQLENIEGNPFKHTMIAITK